LHTFAKVSVLLHLRYVFTIERFRVFVVEFGLVLRLVCLAQQHLDPAARERERERWIY
jgi:hypothetical protein